LRFYLNDSIASSLEQAQPLRPLFTTLLTQHPMIDTLLQIIAPHECIGCGAEGAVLCPECQKTTKTVPSRCFNCLQPTKGYSVCAVCKEVLHMDSAWVCGVYDGLLKQAIGNYKFHGKRSAAKDLANMLLATLPPTKSDVIVVHIPTATSRVRLRGFDHALLLAKKLAYSKGLVHMSALRRTSQARQLGLKRRQRIANMQGVFVVPRPLSIQNAHILLVDDVVTTGASLSEAAKVLKYAGARRVDCVVIAQTPL
jgi:ComF family protein